jgi:glycosyltransferase involved in cell wall biosynthesis
MKGLQYMALEVATVMSAVGTNKVVIQDGVNGKLCSDNESWYIILKELIQNDELRNRLGKAGRITIEEAYSSDAQSKRFISLFS